MVLSQSANSWDLMDILLTMNLKKEEDQIVNINYLLYGGILPAIKDYQRKLGLKLKGSFVVTDAPV